MRSSCLLLQYYLTLAENIAHVPLSLAAMLQSIFSTARLSFGPGPASTLIFTTSITPPSRRGWRASRRKRYVNQKRVRRISNNYIVCLEKPSDRWCNKLCNTFQFNNKQWPSWNCSWHCVHVCIKMRIKFAKKIKISAKKMYMRLYIPVNKMYMSLYISINNVHRIVHTCKKMYTGLYMKMYIWEQKMYKVLYMGLYMELYTRF